MEPEPAARRTIDLLDTRYISTTITAEIATPTLAIFSPGHGRAIFGGLAVPDVRGGSHAEGRYVALVAPCGFATGAIADSDKYAVNHLLGTGNTSTQSSAR